MDSHLPPGWTIERVRAHSGVADAHLLSTDRLVVLDDLDQRDYTTLRPGALIAFGRLCLVWDGDEWLMGDLDEDGSVICWGSYGSDLAEAIRNL
ncbi:hypothetical protein ACFXKD_11675 [Nocardiopsis aegyptia]|uniref:hypothetical protein n=1 Tax=Nocardiopsis aegyptia TaxID=220378 RepID=UPI003672B1D8